VKLEEFSYNVVMKTLEVLEKQHNYKIPEKVKKEIVEAVLKEMDSLITA
jgi:hypothetical protein